MRELCKLVAVGPGGSGVRAAKARYHRIESQWPPASDNIIYIPWGGESLE